MLYYSLFNKYSDNKQEAEPQESKPANSIKETKERLEQIEKLTISSSDDIGNKLDQQKIGIFDWNDKIVKATKKLEKLKKNKKQKDSKKEIKGILGKIIYIRNMPTFGKRVPDIRS